MDQSLQNVDKVQSDSVLLPHNGTEAIIANPQSAPASSPSSSSSSSKNASPLSATGATSLGNAFQNTARVIERSSSRIWKSKNLFATNAAASPKKMPWVAVAQSIARRESQRLQRSKSKFKNRGKGAVKENEILEAMKAANRQGNNRNSQVQHGSRALPTNRMHPLHERTDGNDKLDDASTLAARTFFEQGQLQAFKRSLRSSSFDCGSSSIKNHSTRSSVYRFSNPLTPPNPYRFSHQNRHQHQDSVNSMQQFYYQYTPSFLEEEEEREREDRGSDRAESLRLRLRQHYIDDGRGDDEINRVGARRGSEDSRFYTGEKAPQHYEHYPVETVFPCFQEHPDEYQIDYHDLQRLQYLQQQYQGYAGTDYENAQSFYYDGYPQHQEHISGQHPQPFDQTAHHPFQEWPPTENHHQVYASLSRDPQAVGHVRDSSSSMPDRSTTELSTKIANEEEEYEHQPRYTAGDHKQETLATATEERDTEGGNGGGVEEEEGGHSATKRQSEGKGKGKDKGIDRRMDDAAQLISHKAGHQQDSWMEFGPAATGTSTSVTHLQEGCGSTSMTEEIAKGHERSQRPTQVQRSAKATMPQRQTDPQELYKYTTKGQSTSASSSSSSLSSQPVPSSPLNPKLSTRRPPVENPSPNYTNTGSVDQRLNPLYLRTPPQPRLNLLSLRPTINPNKSSGFVSYPSSPSNSFVSAPSPSTTISTAAASTVTERSSATTATGATVATSATATATADDNTVGAPSPGAATLPYRNRYSYHSGYPTSGPFTGWMPAWTDMGAYSEMSHGLPLPPDYRQRSHPDSYDFYHREYRLSMYQQWQEEIQSRHERHLQKLPQPSATYPRSPEPAFIAQYPPHLYSYPYHVPVPVPHTTLRPVDTVLGGMYMGSGENGMMVKERVDCHGGFMGYQHPVSSEETITNLSIMNPKTDRVLEEEMDRERRLSRQSYRIELENELRMLAEENYDDYRPRNSFAQSQRRMSHQGRCSLAEERGEEEQKVNREGVCHDDGDDDEVDDGEELELEMRRRSYVEYPPYGGDGVVILGWGWYLSRLWHALTDRLRPASAQARDALRGKFVTSLVTIVLEAILLQRHLAMTASLAGSGSDISVGAFEISSFRPLTIYYTIFILATVFGFGILWDAAIHKNSLQVIAFTIFEWCVVSYSGLQIWQHDQLMKDIGIPAETLVRLGDPTTKVFLLSQLAVQIAAAIGITSLTWRLYSEFGWLVFQKLGADVSLRKMMKEYRLLFTLLKLDAFFFFVYALQVATLTDKHWVKGLVEVAFAIPLSSILIGLGFCALRKESKVTMLGFIACLVLLIGYMVYQLDMLWQDLTGNPETDPYFFSRKTMTVFAALTLFMTILAVWNSIAMYFNFNKGFKEAMAQYRIRRSGTIRSVSTAPSSFRRHQPKSGLFRLGSKDARSRTGRGSIRTLGAVNEIPFMGPIKQSPIPIPSSLVTPLPTPMLATAKPPLSMLPERSKSLRASVLQRQQSLLRERYTNDLPIGCGGGGGGQGSRAKNGKSLEDDFGYGFGYLGLGQPTGVVSERWQIE
ncbi:hypothetical protein BGW38_006275 [Lunasporangiospora selenospora]|uniref:Uncharacterized protein n=1 Tax=Lunasporangiospora selenospora TaxID=979761 RepID=A0A9P6KJ11_9FUNG|nr:hypothetical protein BGW38_006275 [Lunasporangiospora selenospora]